MSDLIYKLNKTSADIEELLLQHKNLVYFMLSQQGQLMNQDCESAAWEALWDAVCTFDVYSKTQFSTYACTLIRNAINNELRKQSVQNMQETLMFDFSDYNTLMTTVDLYDYTVATGIEEVFNEYLRSTSGLPRNVLLLWNASSYEASGKDIAKACGCSPSYVSRVQRDFRAYLQHKLKRQ